MNKNHVAPYCVDPRLKQDAHSIFVLNYVVFRMGSGCFETPQIFKKFSPILELSQSSIDHRSL